MKIQKKLSLFITLLILASCSHRSLDFSIISTKRIDLSKGDRFVKMSKRINAVDRSVIITIFPTSYPSFQQAVEKGLAQAPGAVAIADGTMHERFWWIPFIFGRHEIKISGVPIMYKDNVGSISSFSNPRSNLNSQQISPTAAPKRIKTDKSYPDIAGEMNDARSGGLRSENDQESVKYKPNRAPVMRNINGVYNQPNQVNRMPNLNENAPRSNYSTQTRQNDTSGEGVRKYDSPVPSKSQINSNPIVEY